MRNPDECAVHPAHFGRPALCVFTGDKTGSVARVNDLLGADIENDNALLYAPEKQEREFDMEIG